MTATMSKRMSIDEAIALIETADLKTLGRMALARKKELHPEGITTFVVDRNINFKSGIKNRMSYTDEDVNLYKSLLDEMGFDGIGINNFGN